MRNWWWKILGLLLMGYTILAGFLVPLHPALVAVSTSKLVPDSTQSITVDGYNTQFLGTTNRAWLKLDSLHAVEAKVTQVPSNHKITLEVRLPRTMPYKKDNYYFTLLIENEKMGVALLPTAFAAQCDSISTVSTAWVNTITGLHKTPGTTFPYRNILVETIRNLYFHVPLWFAMLLLFTISMVYAVKHLGSNNQAHDDAANALALVGTVFGVLGIVTGAIWAKYTWGAYWSFDVKQNMSLIAILIYCAYFVLRSSFDDEAKRGRISAVYNIFAYATLIPLLFVIPRLADSLHPGNGGNPALGSNDLDNTMRMVFYPGVIGFMLIGLWISTLWYRYFRVNSLIQEKQLLASDNFGA